jgi:hypothetical protein
MALSWRVSLPTCAGSADVSFTRSEPFVAAGEVAEGAVPSCSAAPGAMGPPARSSRMNCDTRSRKACGYMIIQVVEKTHAQAR